MRYWKPEKVEVQMIFNINEIFELKLLVNMNQVFKYIFVDSYCDIVVLEK